MLWTNGKQAEPPPPPPPLPNTYWVQPGRLLAGEYPGSMSRAEAMERIQMLLRAGVTSFVDLTEEGELPEYEPLLPELTEQRIHYRRFPILDHGLPEPPGMTQIVDAIEEELEAGQCVYVHCHAGIGRTGTAIGCLLIRGGFANEDALDHLNILWRQSARSRRWPSVPETDEQVEFVRHWREVRHAPGVRRASLLSRYEGALLGLALGDAVGVLVAANGFDAAAFSGGSHGVKTSVHTAMTRVIADSLLALGRHDATDQMQRYRDWIKKSEKLAPPAELRRALSAWQWSKKPNAGTHDPRNLDSHTLPRTLAVALLMRSDPAKALDLAAEVSRTTQQAPIVLDLCRVWAAQIIDALDGVDKHTLAARQGPAMQAARARAPKPPVLAVLDGRAPANPTARDALAVTWSALESFGASSSFRDALLSVGTKRAPPAAVALCGALSGAHYGVEAIPPEWRKRLKDEEAVLRLLAHKLSG